LLNGGDLLLEPIGDIFGQNGYSGITATLSNTVGDTQLEAQFCWQPGCDNLLPGLWPITFRGISSPDCALPVTVDTALFIQVAQPSNSPPTITIEELPSEVLPGQEYCLTVVVQDPDDFALLHLQGTSPEFEAQFGYGAGLRLVASDTVIQPNPHLRLTYCFSPNCYQKRETYTIQVLALDSTSCDTTLAVPASWTTPVADCGIWMPNVFTPNGDGANDDFGPGLLPGVDYYRMTILDRWGNQIFHTANSQRWRGDVRGGGICAEGVYFYVIEYFFHSGTGPRLVDTRTGHVTVLR
jgi:gliding motility-associated-like protein